MTTPNLIQDIIEEIYGERPELALFGRLGQSNLGRNQREFLRSQAPRFLQQYQQRIANQLSQGQLPNLSPSEFFNNDFDPLQEYYRLPPQQRGLGISQFAPRTRFLPGR